MSVPRFHDVVLTSCALACVCACRRNDVKPQAHEQAAPGAQAATAVTTLAFGYSGFATSDTDLDTLRRDHSVSLWFLPQYEGAGRAILLSDATGRYRIGLAPYSSLAGAAMEVVIGDATFTAPIPDPVITTRDPQRGLTTPSPRWRRLSLTMNGDQAELDLDGNRLGSFAAKGRNPMPPLYFGRLARSGATQDQYYGLLADVVVSASGKPSTVNVLSTPTLKLHGAVNVMKLAAPLDAARDLSAFQPPRVSKELRLPLPKNQVWLVIQGINSAASHYNEAAFALDFVRVGPKLVEANPEHRAFGTHAESAGQSVLAAAAGEVVASVGCFGDEQRGGCDRRQPATAELDPAQRNLVCVRHAEGEHSCYLHLQHGSVRVQRGARVAAGDILGRVGSTGARSAHLHFAVSNQPEANTPGVFTDVVTVPFEFSDYTVSDDFGRTFHHVQKGVPRVGQWVCAGSCANLLPRTSHPTPRL